MDLEDIRNEGMDAPKKARYHTWCESFGEGEEAKETGRKKVEGK